MGAELSPNHRDRDTQEFEPYIAPEPKVYPMGFTPAIKQKLIDYANQTIIVAGNLSEVGQQLSDAVQKLSSRGGELQNLFELARSGLEYSENGGKLLNEERDFITYTLHTEEELAVIFAKISRSPGSFEEIGKGVTEEGARKFHEKWVVSIEGYGHASVAEHAIVHLAVENIPSLDGDWVTDNRLASYTEFSARFKGRQDVGYFTPDTVRANPNLSRRWHEVHGRLFSVYDELMAKGLAYVITEEAIAKHPDRKVLTPDGKVKSKVVADQFKNLMPLSRLTSIGVTMNAREAENAIKKMLSAPHPSIQRLGVKFKDASQEVAPTLVKYAERNEYMVLVREGIGKLVEEGRFQGDYPETKEEGNLVELVDYDRMGEDRIIAAALYQQPGSPSLRELLGIVHEMSIDEKRKAINMLLGNLGKWDTPVRALEFGGYYLFEFPGMTTGEWREYKRHRMQSYAVKEPDVKWGHMVPPLAFEMDESSDSQFHGCARAINDVTAEVESLFEEVYKLDPYAAQYAVTRFHYRPAIAMFNTREAFSLLGLRTGPSAHPFIRRLMWPTFDLIKKVHPIITEHLRLKVESPGRPTRDFVWTY